MLTAVITALAFEAPLYSDAWRKSASRQFYCSPAWLHILSRSFPNIRILGLELREHGEALAVIPVAQVSRRRYVSLPLSPAVEFIDLGVSRQPLDWEPAVSHLAKAEDIVVELRTTYGEGHSEIAETSSAYVTTQLNLRKTRMAADWTENVRRNVKKASKNRVLVEGSDDYGLMHEFLCRTRRRQGTPMYPRALFKAIAEVARESSEIRLLLALTPDRIPISGMVMFDSALQTTYAFGASCEDPDLIATRGNFMLFAHCIEAAKTQGLDVFDFGISPRSNEGLIKFKEQWGAVSSPAPIAYFNRRSTGLKRDGMVARVGSSILQCAPDPIYRTVSPLLFKLAM